MLLRAAVLRNLRPTTFLLGKQPHSKWSELDRVLALAFQMYQDEISSDSGLPSWLTRSLSPDVTFVVEEHKDNATAALQDWDETEGKKKKKRKGIVRYVVAMDAEGKPLEYGGLTRQQFREAARQDEQDLIDEAGATIEKDRPDEGYDFSQYGDGVTNPA